MERYKDEKKKEEQMTDEELLTSEDLCITLAQLQSYLEPFLITFY